MKITLLEPFFTGSHQNWCEGFQKHSQHDCQIYALPGRHWKWRMFGGAVTLAEKYLENGEASDLLVASDMLDLTTFLALTRKRTSKIPVAVYFHENQITYPWSPTDADVTLRRNNQYGFVNYTSALAADRLFFNSQFHKDAFVEALPAFLRQFPDHRGLTNIAKIEAKSEVLSLGLDLKRFDECKLKSNSRVPILLWNHRWEYDKNPDLFFKTLFALKAEGIDFQLVVLGEAYQKIPAIFKEAQQKLADRLLHFGYAPSFEVYANWLWQADILPVTSQQDFFGGSVVEAIYCNCYPILPRRLAYPEHIPSTWHDHYFYDTDGDFHQKLKQIILNFSIKEAPRNTRDFVAQYDWSTLAPYYDRIFEKMKTNYASH